MGDTSHVTGGQLATLLLEQQQRARHSYYPFIKMNGYTGRFAQHPNPMANTQFHVQLKADTEFWFKGFGFFFVLFFPDLGECTSGPLSCLRHLQNRTRTLAPKSCVTSENIIWSC